jgi:hypothetical protein
MSVGGYRVISAFRKQSESMLNRLLDERVSEGETAVTELATRRSRPGKKAKRITVAAQKELR